MTRVKRVDRHPEQLGPERDLGLEPSDQRRHLGTVMVDRGTFGATAAVCHGAEDSAMDPMNHGRR
jgi:hypothetical protein